MTKVDVLANTEATTVLSDDVKVLFEEALSLRASFKTELEKILLSKYNYSEDYSDNAELTFAETVTPTVLGTSTIVKVEDGKLVIELGAEAAKTPVRFAIASASVKLNTILFVVTKVAVTA